MRTLKAAAVYFGIVFGAGFALGTIRVLAIVPRLGERTAELLEMPVMLTVTFFAAGWTMRRFAFPPEPAPRLAVGLLALGFLVAMELAMVLGMRRLTLREFLTGLDPVAGSAFAISLALFGMMPALVARRP